MPWKFNRGDGGYWLKIWSKRDLTMELILN